MEKCAVDVRSDFLRAEPGQEVIMRTGRYGAVHAAHLLPGLIEGQFRAQSQSLNIARHELVAELPKETIERELYDDTLSIFGYSRDDVAYFFSVPIEFGKKAHIVYHEVILRDGKSLEFISYIADGNGRSQGYEGSDNFRQLTNLSQQFEERLRYKYKAKYRVIRPLCKGWVHIKQMGCRAFTMPYVGLPYGELHVEVIRYWNNQKELTGFTPFFRYAVNWTEEMEEISAMCQQDALILRNGQPHSELFEKQQDDIVKALILLWKLTDYHFPYQFLINSGDYMAIISDKGLDLILTCIRGGLRHIGPEPQALFNAIQQHLESHFSDLPRDTYLEIFSFLTQEHFLRLHEETMRMLTY